ncbi:glycosyltransferase family 1 protein [Leptospira montravelensis]|uniref:Glycosyltransferase family 1 protein n=1 Tax=Leptospira montravelensis TaxID=2484961 RepID=A0ABY2LWF9_9LEPT|nr:glycosyltransferase family 4 protein [Leptospira montravelensis]TGK83440.1 glycosyltransferase family 1 protein [Leptospira montravelensis]TGL05442.1 glycosyltransferase family 1 protein [Leptospira montravelensis]
MNEIKVLLLSPLPPPSGGDSTWTVMFMENAPKLGVSVSLVNTSLIGQRSESAGYTYSLFDELKRAFYIWTNLLKILIQLKKTNIVHFNSNCSPKGLVRDYLSVLLIKLFSIPIVFHCHCNVPDQLKESRIGFYFLKRIIRLVDKVIVLNSISKNFISTNFHIAADIVPNFINLNLVGWNRNRVVRKLKKITFTGHIRRSKGILEIFKVAKDFPELTFYLIGPKTESLDTEEPIGSNVKLLGSMEHDQVLEFLINSDLFVFPSHTEGFSVSMLEAMASALPIVATNVGANEDMIEAKGGIIIPTNDSLALKNAIERMKDTNLRKKMSDFNIAKVKNHYTSDIVLNEYINIYKLLV